MANLARYIEYGMSRSKKLPGVLHLRHWYFNKRADACLVSFPKSGRTWLRVMLGRALQQHYGADPRVIMNTSRLCRLDKRIPSILVTHDEFAHEKAPECISYDKSMYKSKRVIFLVRDPRDVIVSLYFQKVHRRGRKSSYKGSLSDFIYERVGGIESLISFYNSWMENQHAPRGFLLLRYEVMKTDAEGEFRRVLAFLGIDWLPNAVVREAVEYSSFENMKRIEAADELKSGSLRTADTSHDETYKVRKGKVGGYVDYLATEEIQYLDEIIKEKLSNDLAYYK